MIVSPLWLQLMLLENWLERLSMVQVEVVKLSVLGRAISIFDSMSESIELTGVK